MKGASAAEPVDGRQTRTLRSRQALCDAYLDLMQEGVLLPSADQIAGRARLSRRSVFNHFTDLAALSAAVVEAGMRRFEPLLEEIPADAPVAMRVAKLAEVCARFYEGTTPFRRSIAAGALVGPAQAAATRVARALIKQQRDRVAELFADELAALDAADRAELVEALDAAVSPGNWEHLRSSRGLSLARARAVMLRSMTALLRDAGVEVR